jgi:C4-dicarboxylate-specific signal transduction histidine kinase
MLRQTRDELEVRVQERTAELQQLNDMLQAEIAERKRTEEMLAQVNRTLQTLYQCEQALVHATAEYELLQSICQSLVEVGGLRMVWVGYRELDAEKMVRPVAQAGYERGYLEHLHVTWADTERGRGPTGTAIRTSKACWTTNIQTDPSLAPWRAEALKRGYLSSLALPLMSDGELFGALTLYAEEPDAFNERTLERFTELANNLAYGVIALRTREERKQAEEALRKAQADLAHVTRVLTMSEMTASIAHEVNQPLTAIVTNGNACLRWLARETPDLTEARKAVERMIGDGNRASDVIKRIRALVKKEISPKVWLDINEVIAEALALVQREVQRSRVVLRTELADDLFPVLGDRVQLQQVMLNLLMNGIEAMSGVRERARELLVSSGRDEANGVLVAVRDSGIGLDSECLARLFDAFYTTKPQGMGMGLAISRSIIEAHGGRLWATPNAHQGAVFQFTLPADGERES